MPRVLHMKERRVAAADRAVYLASLRARRAEAAPAQVQVWAFEHADEPGRFLEFVEGTDTAVRSVLPASLEMGALWHGVPELS